MNNDDLFVWPCGTWCYRNEAVWMTHISDDYKVLEYLTEEWQDFLDSNAVYDDNV